MQRSFTSLHLTPKIMLTERPIFNLPIPNTTDIEEWRKVFEPLKETATDPADIKNVDRILHLVSIANECGATRISAAMKYEEWRYKKGKYDKLLEFQVEFKSSTDEMTFYRRLNEI